MKVRSVKTNYFLNLVRAASYALITIITMPYVNRILGPASIGKVEYVNTIINYFILFSALGIPLYGIREIAKVRTEKVNRDKLTVELLLILTITSLLSYLVLFGIIYQLNFFESYRELILLMSIMIVLSNLGAEWYFQGMEDQVYITIRYVLVRIIAVVLLFLMVREPGDELYYAITIVITVCGSNVFNVFFLLKEIDFKKITLKSINLKKHLKPIFTIFLAAVSINIYLQLDNFMISSISGDKFLGYYAVSNKLIRFVITFITIIGVVLLPRLSNLYGSDTVQYNYYLKKSFNFIVLVAIPSTILFFVYPSSIIELFASTDFEPSVLTMRILSPLCIIVGIAYFLGYLLLYTQNSERIYTKAVLVSALFSVGVNFFAISRFQQNGAAVVAVLSELLAIIIMLYFVKQQISELKLYDRNFLKIVFAGIVTFLLTFFSYKYMSSFNHFIMIGVLFLPFLIFYMLLFLFKENVLTEIVTFTVQKVRNKGGSNSEK